MKKIYLEDAIDVTYQEPSYNDPINVLTEVRDRLKALPPAEPDFPAEIITCKNCQNDKWCSIQEAAMAGENFFCGAAERKNR